MTTDISKLNEGEVRRLKGHILTKLTEEERLDYLMAILDEYLLGDGNEVSVANEIFLADIEFNKYRQKIMQRVEDED